MFILVEAPAGQCCWRPIVRVSSSGRVYRRTSQLLHHWKCFDI